MKYITSAVVLTTLIGIFASCTDGNDWGTDSNYAKEFRPNKLSVSKIEGTTSLKCTFAGYGGDNYEVQASRKSFPINTGDAEVDEADIVKAFSKSSPVTIEGLRPYKPYYVRLRALSNSKSSSGWINNADSKGENISVETSGEQLLKPVDAGDITESSITASWEVKEGFTPSYLEADYEGSDGPKRVKLSEEEIAASSATVSELLANKKYTVKLYMGELKEDFEEDLDCIGKLENVKTRKAQPKTDYYYDFDGTAFTQDVMDQIEKDALAKEGVNPQDYSVLVRIPAGNTITVVESSTNSSVKVPSGMSLFFYGVDENSKSTINLPKILNVSGAHTTISFENINLIEPDANNSSYVINQPDAASACNISELSFRSCFISNFGRGLVRHRYGNIDKIEISDCIVTGTNDYSLIQQEAPGFGSIDIDGSTFYNIYTNLILDKNQSNDLGDISIKNCTFYNCFASSKYWIDLKNKNTANAKVVIENVIVGHLNPVTSSEKAGKGIRAKNVEVTNLIETNDVKWGGESDYVKKGAAGVTILDLSSDQLFTNPAGNDFTLKQYYDCGDPRWKIEEPAEDTGDE